ncbi:MAG: glycosyltransferase [Gammaproteobacteria bacterium]|nr:glycosyltransferase [Gammaproteobacteria bacterium]
MIPEERPEAGKPGAPEAWPPLDVSIVTHNSAEHLATLLGSLAEQAACDIVRVTFVDNASSDDTVAVLLDAQLRYRKTFAAFEVLTNSRNVGFGAAHNRGIGEGSAPFVLILNPDTRLEANCLARLLRTAAADDSRIAAWEPRQVPYEHPKKYDPVTMATTWCSAAALLMRRSAFEDVGGFDARIFLYCEDVDLSWRLRRKGWRLRYVPAACVRHDTYEFAHQIKPVQAVQTLLGSLHLRNRYGSLADVLRGYEVFLRSLLAPPLFKGHRKATLLAGGRYLRNFLHFWERHKPSDVGFFDRLDFAPMRLGAFHQVTSSEDPRERPLVSILVRSIGRQEQLRRALTTIANQTYGNLEVVLVEDGPATLAGLVNSLTDLAINYVPLGTRHGRCHAGNVAMQAASGQYLGFLDEDDELFADHVEQLVACLASTGARAAYSTAFEVPTEWNERHEIVREGPCEVVFDRPFTFIELSVRNFMPTCCVLFERSLYKECGGFDLALDRQEDWNLWLRFAMHAGRFARIRKTTSLYRVPLPEDDRASRQKAMLQYYEKARASHQDVVFALPAEELSADYRTLLECHADGHGRPWPLQKPTPESRTRRWTRAPIRILRKALGLART